jgi:hypothetical protein
MLCKCGCNRILCPDNVSGYKRECYWKSGEGKKRISGKGNPFFGKHHSEKTKLLLSKKLSGKPSWNKGRRFPEFGLKISKALAGKPKSKKWMESIKDRWVRRPHPMLGKHHSAEAKRKMSIAKAKLIAKGKFTPYNRNSGYFYSTKNGKTLHYRASSEKLAYSILEKMNNVLKYETEPFYIEYLFNGETKNYIPDILIYYDNNSKELIEVKPKNHMSFPMNVAKRKAASDYCYKNGLLFSTWTDVYLKKLTENAAM